MENLQMRFRKPSSSMLVALLALFVALGGSSYAALKLPKGSVGTKQIKNGAVTSKKVKNNSLLVGDFKASERSRLQGPRGLQGLQGPQGAQGEAGRSALTSLRSGETLLGGFALDTQASGPNGQYGVWVPFPISTSQTLTDAQITVVQVGGTSTTCTGSEHAPTAPPGRVCVYVGAVTPAGDTVQGLVLSPKTSQHGFLVRLTSTALDEADVRAYGTWAYTSP
jgi:hypothetical protein